MTNKEKYIVFCKTTDVPVFSQPWWLDAVCIDGHWDVLLYENGDTICGALPYYIKKRFLVSYITQPQLTQNNGVVIKYPTGQSEDKRLAYEKKVMSDLISQLEKLPICFYQQSFHFSYTNWLPFYWKGYKQTTRYTYRLDNIIDKDNLDDIMHFYNKKKRKEIVRASKQNFKVCYGISAEEFYEHHERYLQIRGRKISYSFRLIDSIIEAVVSNEGGEIIVIRGGEGNLICFCLVIKDKNTAYTVVASVDSRYKSTGVYSLLDHECVKYAARNNCVLDFEGSMKESVERSYRRMGTKQIPYFRINKVLTKNPLIRLFINWKLR